jgi:RNA ligase (TIGR02306 family)
VTDPRFAFLSPRGLRTMGDGVSGHVLRTVKLRGQYSQGLALPLASFAELDQSAAPGTNVTAQLRVVKWEAPVPAGLGGLAHGPRPSWIPATDEDRIQNLPQILAVSGDWVATEKIDGSSITCFLDPEGPRRFGVCSRNLELVDAPGSLFWTLARSHRIEELLSTEFGAGPVAVQGEVYGPGVQGNRLAVRQPRLAIFTLRVGGREVPRADWPDSLLELSVPLRPELSWPGDVDEALATVDRLRSAINPERLAEGVVWRLPDRAEVESADGQILRASVKVISNRYLLKFES